MRVVLRVPAFRPVQDTVKFVQRAEAAGFDGVGLIDSQMITRDVVVCMTAAALATSRIRIAPAVTNPISRHVSVWASAIQSIEELAPGRIEMWLGRGASALNLAGLPYATPRQLRKSVIDMRRLMAGEWDVYDGVHTHMTGTNVQVPIRVVGSGPMALKMGGALGDSVMIAAGADIESINKSREIVRQGAIEAGRNPDDVDISVVLMTSIRENREDAYRWASPMCARNLGNAAWLAATGIDNRGLKPPPGLANLYPDFFHAEDWDYAMAQADFMPRNLLAEMAPRIGLVGSPEDAVERLKEVSAAGFKEVFLQVIGTVDFPEAELQAYEKVIGAAARALP